MFWNHFYIGESNTWMFVKNLAIRMSSKGTLFAVYYDI